MINEFKQIEDFFKELDNHTQSKVNIYIIGGAALLKRRIKFTTKDIDIIVSTRKEYLTLKNLFIKKRFSMQLPGKEYSNMNLSQIFQKQDLRIDLFEKEVCNRFSLSENMKKRAEKIAKFNHITIHICSNEDIFLFKTMTEREGDISDCINIAQTKNPNWKTILTELKEQIKQSKQEVWITWVGERLDLLKERGLDIPIMKQVNKLREDYFDYLEKKLSK